ncbi:MAG: SRPBCC family protein, partial [Solirubrobacteraceae bacterium]
SLSLESCILLDVPFPAIDPVFSDPRSLVLWDRSVAEVEVKIPGPLRAGFTFDTIGYTRGGRPGKRSSYEVVQVTPRESKTRLVNSRVFDDALWTMQFEPIEGRTRTRCIVEMTLRRRFALLGLVLRRMTRAIDRDLEFLKAAIEGRYNSTAPGAQS